MTDEKRKAEIKKSEEQGNKVKEFLAKIYMILTGASLEVNKDKKKSDGDNS